MSIRIITLFLLCFSSAIAESRVTFDGNLAQTIAAGSRVYAKTNLETTPAHWTDLWAIDIEAINKELLKQKRQPLQALYVFMPSNSVFDISGCKVIAIPIQAIKEDGRLGRHVVCQSVGGEIVSGWVSEEDFLKNLKQSSIILPAPDPSEVAAARATAEALIAKERHEYEMIIAAAPKPTAAEVRQYLWRRVKNLFVETSLSDGSVLRMRPLPIALAVGLVIVFGIFGCRWVGKR